MVRAQAASVPTYAARTGPLARKTGAFRGPTDPSSAEPAPEAAPTATKALSDGGFGRRRRCRQATTTRRKTPSTRFSVASGAAATAVRGRRGHVRRPVRATAHPHAGRHGSHGRGTRRRAARPGHRGPRVRRGGRAGGTGRRLL